MRYLALDWGEVRIGAAISDPDGKIAFPMERYLEPKNSTTEIKKLIQELEIEKILIGLPKALSGNSTASTEKARAFAQDLQASTGVRIEMLDERLSSVAAGRQLSDQGVSEKNQRQIKDNLAAQMMLQQYLDQTNK